MTTVVRPHRRATEIKPSPARSRAATPSSDHVRLKLAVAHTCLDAVARLWSEARTKDFAIRSHCDAVAATKGRVRPEEPKHCFEPSEALSGMLHRPGRLAQQPTLELLQSRAPHGQPTLGAVGLQRLG